MLLGLLSIGATSGMAEALTASTALSNDGVYQLAWEVDGEVTLEEASSADFAEPRVVYRGTDGATTLTGKRNGEYFYRLAGRLPSSEPIAHVVVEHHPLSRAIGFFSVGFTVFAATVAVVLRGPDDDGESA